MNLPFVLGHAGEEIVYVLVPVALIMWLRSVAKRRNETEDEQADGAGPREESPENTD